MATSKVETNHAGRLRHLEMLRAAAEKCPLRPGETRLVPGGAVVVLGGNDEINITEPTIASAGRPQPVKHLVPA